MDFALTEAQLAVQRLAREFGEREIGDRPNEWDREERFPPRAISRRLGEIGLMGGAVPERWGGSGLDYVSLVLAVEEIARFCTVTGRLLAWASCSLGQGMLLHGTDELRETYLRPLCRGERLGGTWQPIRDKTGARTMDSGQLFFDNVRVPARNRVGAEYAGNQVRMAGTEIGRLACAARALGGTRAGLDASVGRHFRDAKFMQIDDGINEIHQVIIAEHALGVRGG